MKIEKSDIYRSFLFLSSLLLVGFLWDSPYILLIVMMALFVVSNYTMNWKYLKTSIVCAVLGPAAEVIAIALGAWTYSVPQFVGIPFWLAPLWGVATLFFINLAKILRESGK